MPEWNPRANDLFVRAVEIDSPADRRLFLEQQCGGDAALQAHVESLLAAGGKIGSFLEKPAMPAPPPGDATAAYRPLTEGPGTVIGPYKLLQHIGEGGFGAVYMAEQEHPVRRKVALKIIKFGMDTREVIARFESERQALAMMEHPNIARVFDAGATESGRPYFVMELVRGVPITEFCDKNKFSAEQRLKLFVTVCNAIQHAHHKGIIHRDIKPSNVMVTLHDGVPVVKVIDFGVAKATAQKLTERTLFTAYGQMIGTPAYMSPEQAEMSGLDIDMRSDIFSLGVLLYELLTGTTPLDSASLRKAGYAEMQRLIREEEAPRPSTRFSSLGGEATVLATNRGTDVKHLSQLLRGELDWIVMKSLEKDRTRRYGSPATFAADVERYLKDEAVEACPPTLGYRLKKAYRRNRAAVLVGGLIAMVFLAAAGVSVGFGVVAKRAEANAVAARDDADEQREDATRQRDEKAAALANLELAQERQAADQYVWDMQLVPLAFEANNIAEVQRLLDRHLPGAGRSDRRGFEWYYWDRQLHTDLHTSRLPGVGTGRGIWAASPDGSRVAKFVEPTFSDPPGTSPVLTVWDIATRKLLLTHRMPIQTPATRDYSLGDPVLPQFSPNGKWIVVEWGYGAVVSKGPGSTSGRLRQVLDVERNEVVAEHWPPVGAGSTRGTLGRAMNAAISPFSEDSRRFFHFGRVWDLEGRKELDRLANPGIALTQSSADGTRLLSQKNSPIEGDVVWRYHRRIVIQEAASGKELAAWDVSEAPVGPAPVGTDGLAFSPTGKRVAYVAVSRTPLEPDQPRSQYVVSTLQLTIWDANNGTKLRTVPVAYLPQFGDKTRFYLGHKGAPLVVERYPLEGPGEVTVWDTETGKQLPSPTGFDPRLDRQGSRYTQTMALTFSPDGKQFVSSERNVLRTWDVATGKPVLTLRGHANTIVARGFAPDGKRLWSLDADGLLKEWDVLPRNRGEIRFADTDEKGYDGDGFAVSPDGGYVARCRVTGTAAKQSDRVVVTDATGKPVQVLTPPPRSHTVPNNAGQYYDQLALSRDGRRVVLYRADPAAANGSVGRPEPPDITVWDVASNTQLLHQKLELDHKARFGLWAFVAISADGRTVAVVTRPKEGITPAVRVFDVDTGRERAPLAAVGERMDGLSFSPDGRRLAGLCGNAGLTAKSSSEQLVVWDLESGSRLAPVECHLDGGFSALPWAQRLAWAPDGSRFAFAQLERGGSVVTVYDATTGKSILKVDQPNAGRTDLRYRPYLAYSPDGKRLAALITSWPSSDPAILKVWDTTSGKEMLTLTQSLSGLRAEPHLTFTRDRLQLVERVSLSQSLGWKTTLTTFSATPVPNREPPK